jgi:hypothetical protein
MKQQASRYASATVPARTILCDLPVDVVFAASARRKRRDDCEQVSYGGERSRDRAHGYLNLPVRLFHWRIEVDLPPAKAPAYDHCAFHRGKLARRGPASQEP